MICAGVAGQVLFSFLTVNVLGAFLVIGGGLQFVHAIPLRSQANSLSEVCLRPEVSFPA